MARYKFLYCVVLHCIVINQTINLFVHKALQDDSTCATAANTRRRTRL